MAQTVSPYKNKMNPYFGTGHGVLKPGTILGADGYTSPSSVLGTSTSPGVYYDPGGGGLANPPTRPTDGWGTGGGGYTAPAPVDPDEALRNSLRAEIAKYGGDIDAVYSSLFGQLDSLIKSQDSELEERYGTQFRKATDQYTGALPEIETSYAAIGAGDSTDQSDAKTGAKKGFDDATAEIGQNKKSDKAKLGQYGKEQRSKITEDRNAAKRNLGRAKDTEDVSALRGMRNDLESNLSSARVTRSTLGDSGSARQELSKLTGDSGRFDQAINALDSVIKSSMSGSVKEAAVKAITDNAGLSPEEKKKVDAQYGNVYAEQQAL